MKAIPYTYVHMYTVENVDLCLFIRMCNLATIYLYSLNDIHVDVLLAHAVIT